MEENDFTDKSLLKFYESDPFHKAFTGEIVCVYQKKWMENSCAFTRRNFFIDKLTKTVNSTFNVPVFMSLLHADYFFAKRFKWTAIAKYLAELSIKK